MKFSLYSKVLFYILIVAFFGVFLTSFSIFFGVENQFSNYLDKNRENNREIIINEAVKQFEETGNLTSEQMLSSMREQAMSENLFYKVYDSNGELVADTTNMLGMMGMMGGMHEQNRSDSEYKMSTYDITSDQTVIGEMEFYYPVELIGEDFLFLESIKQNIYIAVIVTIVLSILFSLLFSKKLSAGFNQLSKAIQELRNHKRQIRVPVNELTNEMKPLGESFNQLAESLFKEEKLRKQFTADFAHELRTPLTTLRSQIEAYQDGIWEPTTERLEQSHGELMRLVRLVNELEGLIAAENPQIKLEERKLDANEILSLIEDQFRSSYREKGVELIVQKPTEDIWFMADRDKLVQIITNIVYNALQYTPSGKKVRLNAKNDKASIHFVISDEGTGISKEDLPYLYERFYRGDKSRDRKTGGIGIGLAIVKALVDAHQGEIKIDSEIGQGTTVTVSLPREK
ncbi:sensor histidine kinase [Saliterribacillus persicus]|uniref:histidine kinase n=1 Tax=Saliterribacillus persicus TaxID=930114 RepID=A0A368Y451_9BACI|nr:HAMP domain-containing sensor histidine kinase [Saliterribacillus persicus]RCW74972.1 HAMP domain-containing protein [Saliterribacillus persicus]